MTAIDDGEAEGSPRHVIRRFFEARKARDRDAMESLLHPMLMFISNANPSEAGGIIRLAGKHEVQSYLATVERHWETLRHDPGTPYGHGDTWNVIVRVKLRHRATDAEFEGTKRQEWIIRGGKCVSMAQYMDRDLINAIHRLSGLSR